MSIIGRSLARNLRFPDDGDDNPKARRRGFSAFTSLARTPDPDSDPTWEARTIPMDPPPVAIHLPFEREAGAGQCASERCTLPDCVSGDQPAGCAFRSFDWTDPDHEDERAEAETIDIRADLRAMQYDLYSNDIG